MLPATQDDDLPEDEARPPEFTGHTALALGAAAVVMLCCPWLPDQVPMWLRYGPLYLVLPTGILAVLTGVVTLRSMRGVAGAGRRRARAGLLLGAVAIVVPLAGIAWACWELRDI
jgi:lysylphosphatidylglycerol synthetase-like protein (DUF2156 family)